MVNNITIRTIITMNDQKPLEFKAGALDYFILTILSIILVYIPFIGWAFLLNYSGSWFAERSLVTGKKVEFNAGFGESLKFVFVNVLLLVVTFGIYSFWFYPKLYRYMAEHVNFVGELAPAPVEPVSATPSFDNQSPIITGTPAPVDAQPQATGFVPSPPTAPQNVPGATTSAPETPQNPQV